MERNEKDIDVAIVGGGPAGLSAALIPGRALKRVWLFDAGPRRNAAAERLHGFVTRDGTPPAEFRHIGREQLRPYAVTFRSEAITSVTPLKQGDGFVVAAEEGTEVRARRVVLALGVIDEVPPIPGMREAWGRGVFQCPHCHGFEHRGKSWGVLLSSDEFADFALLLTGWTRKLIAFTSEAFVLSAQAETSIPALYAAGDATTPLQVALGAAYQGAMAGWMIVHGLNVHAGQGLS